VLNVTGKTTYIIRREFNYYLISNTLLLFLFNYYYLLFILSCYYFVHMSGGEVLW